MEIESDGIAIIAISNPPVNALSHAVIAGLKEKYAEAMRREEVKAIILTGESGKFSGGFDISVFVEVQKTGDLSLLPDVSIDLVMNTIEGAQKPSVAAIQGLALGGGLELAMGCHARISTPDAQLGLPELSLGIIPGFGGTQRLPRLVGLQKAMQMLLLSKPIKAEEGYKNGLVDEIAPPAQLLTVARRWALDIAQGQKAWTKSLHRTDKLSALYETSQKLYASRKDAERTGSNMPQNQACLDAIAEGIVHGGYTGLLKESRLIKELVLSTTSKSLVHVFSALRATSKVPKLTGVGLIPRSIRKVAIIGGGLMGSGIATALILSDIQVVLKERDPAFRGLKSVEANLKGLVKKGPLTQKKMNKALSLLKVVLDYSDFNNVDMVIEAVIENTPLKQTIFNEVEKLCPPHCILATTTSTIDLNIVGKNTNSPDRIIGAHFFSPAHVMPLLEIVWTEKTSPQVILDLMTIGKIMKKVPIVVKNCTGFAINRTFFPYHHASALLVQQCGVDPYRIDRAITKFGMPMGPFQLADLVGYGVALAANAIYSVAFKGRTFEDNLLEIMIRDGRNGKGNGRGFYLYRKGSKPKPDPSLQALIDESRKHSNLKPSGKSISISDEEIVEMIFFPAVNEACRVIDEGVVVRPSDIDVATILGMGFPRYRSVYFFLLPTLTPFFSIHSFT
ncbi:peroxisomal fatty acid beta-oxidation multifunctional protein-like isoform X2 [Phalaenopsis equestris]|uniref:peroxisomal fatty acid beta-oxidation multifunctional protein-like isoform X2 n=1 Tax=Phalaenopsis equestris TaxID=78828 RepID=UPI0009E32D51|nr:peroxisomal fatty acid beta-oxidation multifunctional protein-like isoform X2 [Phalaenopsis equestris]